MVRFHARLDRPPLGLKDGLGTLRLNALKEVASIARVTRVEGGLSGRIALAIEGLGDALAGLKPEFSLVDENPFGAARHASSRADLDKLAPFFDVKAETVLKMVRSFQGFLERGRHPSRTHRLGSPGQESGKPDGSNRQARHPEHCGGGIGPV